MAGSAVERLHAEFQSLVGLLDKAGEPSLRVTADDCFRKVLLLSAASYFERVVTESVLKLVSDTSQHECVISFVRLKCLERQYHSLFNWKEENANQFFGFFGAAFKDHIKGRLKADLELDDAIRAFMEIGRERNRLIHQDLGNFPLEKTAEEIFALYQRANKFAEILPTLLSSSGG